MVTQNGFTVWFTGLSGAGKTTIATILTERLREVGLSVCLLDGDEVRQNLSQDLGFGKEDRDTNIRRIGWVCDLLNRNGIHAVAAAISPYRAVRDEVRAKLPRFVEVHVDAPLEVLAERDVKGLYGQAQRGALSGLTGVDDPYEPPLDPEVTCFSDGSESPDQSASKVLAKLSELGYLSGQGGGASYTEDEEAEVTDRLRDLGYL
jgi:adenylyl-sulfate kinase